MKQEEVISKLFGKREQVDDKPKKKKEIVRKVIIPVKRVDVGQPYWVMKYDEEEHKNLIPAKRIDQGYEEREGKMITKNRHDALYAEVHNYFYSEEECVKAINTINEKQKYNSK